MFGVLVVRDTARRIGFLCGFSGMVDGRWTIEGFVPPLFDAQARDAIWLDGEAEMLNFAERIQAIEQGEEAEVSAELAALTSEHETALAQMAERHRAKRAARRMSREKLDGDAPALAQLDQQSRADKAEHKRLRASIEQACEPIASRLVSIQAKRSALEQQRSLRSQQLLPQMQATYVIQNANGKRQDIAALFAPGDVPGGAGDCAAPKLLGYAYANELEPIALAEFWWGAAPDTGGRHPGVFYPACRGKCGPLLPFMLEGLHADPPPLFGDEAIAAHEPTTVFEDEWLVIVNKPCGLLSVPGRHNRLKDSVLNRLRERYPEATGPMLVHRLDLDTSGLLIAAKTQEHYAALQRLFAVREIDKRYVAWLEGDVTGDSGVVELALRVDIDDRPRQIHDEVHGKRALTEWRVLSRADGRTRVAMYPRTGRTHQLRVHAAHPRGIGAPIVGDRLYGRPGQRLLLHAESLAFVHPHTGKRVEIEVPAPF